MKPRYIAGGLLTAIGVFWMTGITYFLIADLLPVSLQSPAQWAQQVYLPSGALSTIIYLGFLLAWVYYTHNRRCKSCNDAKLSLGLWLSLFGMSIVSNAISLFVFIQFTVVQAAANQAAPGGGTFINAPPYEYLIPMTLINGLILFWLPSCFLSQRTLRFIPPFSYELNTMMDKR
jgi:hypothetical protein